jgi:predicted nucleic acid-binding protein
LIIDTTYLLPLSRIGIDTDLLAAVDEGKINLDIDDFGINLISIFELQAKAAKLDVDPKFASEAVSVINTEFRVEPFYNPRIIRISNGLLKELNDYIDCIIVATAIALNEDLITEDRKIIDNKKLIKDKYKINVFNYLDLIKKSKQ